MEKLKTLMNEYGGVALGVYLSTFVLAMAVFSSLIAFGFSAAIADTFGIKLDSSTGTVTTLGFAWLATKATQPVRIIATLAATPFVAKVLKREKKSVPGAVSTAPSTESLK